MSKFILVVTMLVINIAANAAVQTDTHTYIVGEKSDQVLAINRSSGAEQRIPVGRQPRSMVIQGDLGYVVNFDSETVSVIDLKSNAVIHTIPVGTWPRPIVIHEDLGYVVNGNSHSVSVIDLTSLTVIHTIPVGQIPNQIVIHGDFGYVVNRDSHTVSVIDLKSNAVIHTIPVGQLPYQIVIHGNFGYVVNMSSHSVSVIDLKRHEVTTTLTVGKRPLPIVIHGDFGYVVNWNSNTVSIIDLKLQEVTATLPMGRKPRLIVIHGDFGYVLNEDSKTVSVIDLQRNTVIGTLPNPNNSNLDFSDTHVYLGIKKLGPLYPTLTSLKRMKTEGSLGEFVKMNPKAFEVGEVKPRDYPKNKNEFDLLPPYVLAQNLFWDVDTDKPLMDPVDILATLITMKYPQRFLKSEVGRWLRSRLHMAFFQTVWLGQNEKAQAMLRYFIQLEDPVMTNLATYTLVKPKAKASGATNSTSK